MKSSAAVSVILLMLGAAVASGAETAVLPAKISAADQAGAIFERDDVERIERNGNTVLDVTSMLSSDGRFGSGL